MKNKNMMKSLLCATLLMNLSACAENQNNQPSVTVSNPEIIKQLIEKAVNIAQNLKTDHEQEIFEAGFILGMCTKPVNDQQSQQSEIIRIEIANEKK